MKKKNFLYTGTLALGMFMSGCSDSFLDMNNYGAYDDFNSETKITWYLAGLYQTSFENYTSPTSCFEHNGCFILTKVRFIFAESNF